MAQKFGVVSHQKDKSLPFFPQGYRLQRLSLTTTSLHNFLNPHISNVTLNHHERLASEHNDPITRRPIFPWEPPRLRSNRTIFPHFSFRAPSHHLPVKFSKRTQVWARNFVMTIYIYVIPFAHCSIPSSWRLRTKRIRSLSHVPDFLLWLYVK